MLMVREGLTAHGERLLGILRGAGDEWVTRSFMSDALGKKRLNVWEVKLLEEMAEMGLIEITKRPISSPIGYEWQYRALDTA